MTKRKAPSLLHCQLQHGPSGTMLLIGFDPFRRKPFRAQCFASQANFPDQKGRENETAWTAEGKVKCRGGIKFPAPLDE